jgi:hypothetical protein
MPAAIAWGSPPVTGIIPVKDMEGRTSVTEVFVGVVVDGITGVFVGVCVVVSVFVAVLVGVFVGVAVGGTDV